MCNVPARRWRRRRAATQRVPDGGRGGIGCAWVLPWGDWRRPRADVERKIDTAPAFPGVCTAEKADRKYLPRQLFAGKACCHDACAVATLESSMVQSTRHSSSWPVGQGEMAECIRRHDWAATALGPIAGWPPHLRTAVDICLASPLPIAILWGELRLQLYNDAYCAIAQQRHPAILGRPALENWAEARDLIGPMLDRVFTSGEPSEAEDWPVLLRGAAGVPVERFFTFTFSAIRDRYGVVVGAFHTAVETTSRLRAEQRLRDVTGEAGLGADFRALFQAAPAPLLLLAPPDFRVVAANDALLRTRVGAGENLLDRPAFDLLASWP